MWRFACAFALGGTLSLLACRTDFQEDCPVGNENCACTEDGTCVEGLSCLSGVCVDQATGETGVEEGGESDGSESSSGDTSSEGETTGAETDGGDTTGVEGAIVLWATETTYQGDFDSTGDLRADFNAICQADLPQGAGCIATTALVSTRQEDSLASLETNAGVPAGSVVNTDGVTVAASFTALLEEGPVDSLANLDVLPASDALFWTGTDANLHFDAASSCEGWSSSTEGMARIGSGGSTGATWHSAGQLACSEQASVLCACW